jgi:HK97 family phage major capsid protein
MSYLNRLIEAQNSDLHAARAYIDRADEEKRELSHEERTAWDALNAQMDTRSEHIEQVKSDEARSMRVESSLAGAPELRADVADAPAEENVAAILKDLATGRRNSYVFGAETRAVSTTTTAGGYTIPEGFGGRVIAKMLTVGPMLDANVINLIQTTSNQDIPFPIENARPVGTATAEAAVYGDSTSTFTTKTLRAYKYGTLLLASDELLQSEDVGLQGYLATQLGVAVGTAVNSILTLGTGTVQPEGIAASAGSGVTGSTAVAGVPNFENLVDLVHSVDSLYAASPDAGFMMRRATLGSVRKIKDTAGNYVFVPAPAAGMANTLYGYPIYENPYVAATGTATKSILFGDFSYFLVRQVGGIELSRSNERFWDSDQVGLKVRTWIDSFIGQSQAIKYYLGGPS